MRSTKLINDLQKIMAAINHQIPLAANRYEEFETCPAGADTSYTDQQDQLYFEHEKKLTEANVAFFVNRQLKKSFDQYYVNESPSHRSVCKYLQTEINSICNNIDRESRLLGRNICITQIHQYINHNLETIVDDLIQQREPAIIHEEYRERLSQTARLIEHRTIEQAQMQSNAQYIITSGMQERAREITQKAIHFFSGLYFDRIKSDVGYCQEHAELGLIKILGNYNIHDLIKTIELVMVIYEEGDNHAFLAINRAQETSLSDMSSWGDEAIIFDAWNKLLCYAIDYPHLPLQYHSYPDGAKWSSTKFTTNDKQILNSINLHNQRLMLAGNTNPADRNRMIYEEFELTKLNTNNLAATNDFLLQLKQESFPTNFNIDIEICLTTKGNRYISVIAGLDIPVVAIHIDLLKNIQAQGIFTIDHLRFALASALLEIKYFGVGVLRNLSNTDQQLIDLAIIERFHCANSAIEYLRQASTFEEAKRDNYHFTSHIFSYNSSKVKPDERIKIILTQLARHPEWQGKVEKRFLSVEIITEINSITPLSLFRSKVAEIDDTVAKLNYLTSRLEDLQEELYSSDIFHIPNIRLQDFINTVKSVSIDSNDMLEREALDTLIDRAHELQLPRFKYIYELVHSRIISTTKGLQPLGIFRPLQIEIDAFVESNDLLTADAAAKRLLKIIDNLKVHHYASDNRFHILIDNHNKVYQEKHAGQLPTGRNRFFGTDLLAKIDWKGFDFRSIKDVDRETAGIKSDYFPTRRCSWDKHVEWAIADSNKFIAKCLMLLGVHIDQRYWSLFTELELIEFQNDSLPAIITRDKNIEKGISFAELSNQKMRMMFYISRHHVLRLNMFKPGVTFEDAFKQFYDANIVALESPHIYSPDFNNKKKDTAFNLNNPTINYLLRKFLIAIHSGSEQDKQVVRSFFTGREDHRDFKHMRNHCPYIYMLDQDNLYSQFVIYQRYDKFTFNFFTGDEILTFIHEADVNGNRVTWQEYVKILGLPYQELNIECVEALFNRLQGSHLYGIRDHILKLFLTANSHLSILSTEIIKLTQLTYANEMYQIRDILIKANWDLPTTIDDIKSISLTDLTYLYRKIELCCAFPTPQKRQMLGELVLAKMLQFREKSDRLAAIEQLLFISGGAFDIAIADINLRNRMIDIWVRYVAAVYGQDDQSDAYFEKLKPIIIRVCKNAAVTDQTKILTKLAEAIQSQQKVSEIMGVLLEPEKFTTANNDHSKALALTRLAHLSKTMSDRKEDRQAFLDFLSMPITTASLNEFCQHIIRSPNCSEILGTFHLSNETFLLNSEANHILQMGLHAMHLAFWERPLEERAVVIEYTLIPVSSVLNDEDIDKAYRESLEYVCRKIFPLMEVAGSDDNFANSFLRSYLEVTEPHFRSFLLAGLLVASKQSEAEADFVSVGKKLVLAAEQLGPAYVKIIQAIDSHPDTPEHIRADTHASKSRANPPHRWNLWRLLLNVLPPKDFSRIAHVGELLGSASYNIAVKITLTNGETAVLSLLRENAERDARNGFNHLARAIELNTHERMLPLKETGLAMLREAQLLSEVEMDNELSCQQFAIAQSIYHRKVSVDGYMVHFSPVKLFTSGNGYRIIEFVPGIEFNNLVLSQNKPIIRVIAKAIFSLELINIFRGAEFDSDRHGNQLRIMVEKNHQIKVGLYDFGEMSLSAPNEGQISQLGQMINLVFKTAFKQHSFTGVFDQVMSAYIQELQRKGENTTYLMRIRKGLLALQDFQRHLDHHDIMNILINIAKLPEIHPSIRSVLNKYVIPLKVINIGMRFFERTAELRANGAEQSRERKNGI